MITNRIIVKKYNNKHKKVTIVSDSKINESDVKTDIADETNDEVKTNTKNNKKKGKKNMAITENDITMAENIVDGVNCKKVLKKDKGLIERTESSKIILTEDNRQLLND